MIARKRKKFYYSTYPPEFNEDFKRYVRKRDRFLCSICGERRRLDVHHIDYTKEHTTVLNCISLCRDCHYGVHRSGFLMRTEWKYKLWRLAAERERYEKRIKTVS